MSRLAAWRTRTISSGMMLSGLAILMSTHYFPWNLLSSIPFLEKIVASIQFPWRFLSLAVPLLSYLACLTFANQKDAAAKEIRYCLLAAICLICAFQSLYCVDLIARSPENYGEGSSRISYDYRCFDTSTKQAFPVSRGSNNKVHVDLPDHYSGTLRVDFVEPWHWRAAEMISLITFIGIAVYLWRKNFS